MVIPKKDFSENFHQKFRKILFLSDSLDSLGGSLQERSQDFKSGAPSCQNQHFTDQKKLGAQPTFTINWAKQD